MSNSSIEDVIGDYYKDLYNYLIEIKYSEKRTDLNSDQKINIINKLSKFASEINDLIDGEISFWKQKKNQYILFLVFYIIALVLIFIVMMIFLFLKLKNIKKYGGNMLLTIILFVIIYEIFFTIFIIFIINISRNRKLAKGQINLLKENLNEYLSIVINDNTLKKYFIYLGYVFTDNSKKNSYKDEFKGYTEYIIVDNNSSNELIYNNLKDKIRFSLLNFYNGGYDIINKTILKSNPILLFKECDFIIQNYKDLVIKEITETNNNDNNKIIDNVIISKLEIFIKNNNYTLVDKQSLLFEDLYYLFVNYIYHISYFYYIIHHPEQGYMNPTIKYNPTPNYSKNTIIDQYNDDINLLFTTTHLASIKRMTTIEENIRNDKKFISLLKIIFNNIIDEFKGLNWSAYSKEYYLNVLSKITDNKNTIYIFDMIYNNYINLSINDISNLKRVNLIKNISTDISIYDIEILDYKNYILNKLQLYENSEDISDILEKISINNKNKQRFMKKKDNDSLYVKSTDFIKTIDEISYTSFIENMNIDYFYDIVNNFYIETNKTVNGGKANLKNIYYEKQKNINLWSISINMSISILILITVYMIISNYNIKIIKDKENEDCSDNSYKNSQLDRWIRIIVPGFIVFFVIAIMISWKNKIKAIFNYNKLIIQKNTRELTDSLKDMKDVIYNINSKLKTDPSNNIVNIQDINKIDKIKLYDSIKNVIISYNNCNFIIESAGKDLPFPYAEFFTYLFMIIIIIIVFLYVYKAVDPIKRLTELKELNSIKDIFYTSQNQSELYNDIDVRNGCHMEDMDTVIFSVKIAFVSFIILFLSIYSIKIFISSNDFKSGLFNSVYYKNRKCYNK